MITLHYRKDKLSCVINITDCPNTMHALTKKKNREDIADSKRVGLR